MYVYVIGNNNNNKQQSLFVPQKLYSVDINEKEIQRKGAQPLKNS